MLLALVLALEQSSVVIQLVLRMMTKVHLMMWEERSMELDHKISAATVRLSLQECWPVLDPEPLVVVVQFQFVHDVLHSLMRLLELHPLGLLVHLVCHRYCPRLAAVQFATCLALNFEAFETLLFLPRRQRWSECSQPCWLRLEAG